MEATVQMYSCRVVGRSVPHRVLVAQVSGIGDDEVEVIELVRGCMATARCPRLRQCPLVDGEEFSST
ncbi:hypothetical protein L0936_19370 [Paracidovorax citrulli]